MQYLIHFITVLLHIHGIIAIMHAMQSKSRYTKYMSLISGNFLSIGVLVLAGVFASAFLFHREQKQSPLFQRKGISTTTMSKVPTTPVQTVEYGHIDMNTADWQTYTLNTIGMEFKLPPQISKYVGHLKEDLLTAKNGATYTGTNYSAFGVFNNEIVVMVNADSFDASAGRDALVTDLIGYSVNNGQYTSKYRSSDGYHTIDIPQENVVGELINAHDAHILKVKHTRTNEKSNPYFFFNGSGITTLINTPNQTYPGVVFEVYIPEDANNQILDRILSTITFFPATSHSIINSPSL